MALGLCVWRRAARTVRRRANIVLRRAMPVVSAASACGVAEGIPHFRIPSRVGRNLRRGELLGGAIMRTHATSFKRGVAGSMCESHCALSDTYTCCRYSVANIVLGTFRRVADILLRRAVLVVATSAYLRVRT